MRRALVALPMLALFFAGLPLASGQSGPVSEPPSQVVLGDGAGDVELVVMPRTANQRQNASQVGQGQFDHVDLLRATIGAETEKTFQVSLQLKVLDPPQSARPLRAVTFSYGRVDWQVLAGGCPFPGQGQQAAPPNSGCLRFRDSGSGFRAVKVLQGTRAEGSFVWTIDKADIFNENRVPTRYGAQLVNLSGFAFQSFTLGGQSGGGFGQLDPTGGVFVLDRAGPLHNRPFVFQQGATGRGHLMMDAPEPIRVTNGEATTIVYKVELTNKHSEALSVQITSEGALPDWNVRTPPLLEAPGQSTVTFPVILSLPFKHDHGKTALFTVKADAVEDPTSGASTELGVYWTDVPQPSGHHECESDETCGQWFHSAPLENPAPDQFEAVAPFKEVWFNGVAKDPTVNADDANVPAFFNDYFFCLFNPPACKVPPTWQSSWFFPMSPSLLMGLDFDITRKGLAKLAFLPSVPDPGAKVDVQLLYCDPTKQGGGGPGPFTVVSSACYQYSVLLGSGSVTTPLNTNQQVTVEVPLTMEAAADLLPYQRGANIGLSIRIHSTIPQNTIIVPPRIEFVTKASHLHMPLLEYHDPIDQAFAELGSIKITPVDPFEKPVNPGRTTVFRFEVLNEDSEGHRLDLEVQGINVAWARIVGERVLTLGPGERGNFTLAVEAPESAVAEERAELIVVAQSQDDSDVVTLSRLRATVVVGTDIPDESNLAASSAGGDSSAAGGVLLFAAIGLSLACFRARRRERV